MLQRAEPVGGLFIASSLPETCITSMEAEVLKLPMVQFVHKDVTALSLSLTGGFMGRAQAWESLLSFYSPGKHCQTAGQTAKQWIMDRAHGTQSDV